MAGEVSDGVEKRRRVKPQAELGRGWHASRIVIQVLTPERVVKK